MTGWRKRQVMDMARKRFEQWWDADDDIPNDGPYTPDTPIQFAWAAWQAALAQPEQEPVAYAVYHRMGGGKSLHWREQHSPDGDASEYQLVPIYTTPPQRTWVGLTDEERTEIRREHYARTSPLMDAIEAKLKEKNT
jgi:hypothetical protein